ncbi:YadA-like family protein [Megamonas funiformis]|uniref:YadA-like family protein n=1 Tax=Megamonas funiformis TaxID=437897 RepID=UPI00225A2520|nr:YadA-like family protein [Megamonas funiformis]MCX4130684.1 YadA-like family protein [Megamonas funiformis]
MASNKKAQILAAVMCASSIFGSYTVVSAANTIELDNIVSSDKTSSVSAGTNTITATAGASKEQQSTISLKNGSLFISVGKKYGQNVYDGTFTLNSKNLSIASTGLTLNNNSLYVKNNNGETVGSITNSGAITGTGLTIKDGSSTGVYISKAGNIKAYDGMTITDKSSDGFTTAETKTAYNGISNKIERLDGGSNKLYSTGTTVTVNAVTTTAQGDGRNGISGNSNKTTSTVSTTSGVTDTIYDAGGSIVAKSVVSKTNIQDSFIKDGVTYSVTTNGNGTTFKGATGSTVINGGTIKASEDVKIGSTSLKAIAETVNNFGSDSGVSLVNLAGIKRNSGVTTIEGATSFNKDGMFLSKDEYGYDHDTETEVKAGYIGIKNKFGDTTFSVDHSGAINAANGKFTVDAKGNTTTKTVNGVTIETYKDTVRSANDLKNGDILIGTPDAQKDADKINLSAIDRNTAGITRNKYGTTTTIENTVKVHAPGVSHNVGTIDIYGDMIQANDPTGQRTVIEGNGITTNTITTDSIKMGDKAIDNAFLSTVENTNTNTAGISRDGETTTIEGNKLSKDGIESVGDVTSALDGKTYSLNTIGANTAGITRNKYGTTTTIENTVKVHAPGVSHNVGTIDIYGDMIQANDPTGQRTVIKGNGITTNTVTTDTIKIGDKTIDDDFFGNIGDINTNIAGIERKEDTTIDGKVNATIIEGKTVIGSDGSFSTAGGRFTVEKDGRVSVKGSVNASGDVVTWDGNEQKYSLNTIGDTTAGISRDEETTTIEGVASFNKDGMTVNTGNSFVNVGTDNIVLNNSGNGIVIDKDGTSIIGAQGKHSINITRTGTEFLNGQDGTSTVISGGDITTDSITVAGNTIDNEFFKNMGANNAKTAGIERDGNDITGYTTSIETTFRIHSPGVSHNVGTIDIYGDTIQATTANGQKTIITGNRITTNELTVGGIKFGDLVNRVEDLEDKTQNITPSNPGTGEGGSVVPPTTGGQTGINGDVTVGGDLSVGGNLTADSATIGGVTMKDNTVTATTGNFDNIAVGGENGTTINKDGITVGKAEEGQSYTSITKDDVKVTDSQGNTTSLTDVGNRVTGLESSMNNMNNRLNDVEDRIDKVGAMAAAIANLRTMGFDPEAPTEIAIGVGQYKSETGLALGVFHYPNQDFMLSASISTSGDEVMGGIGATWKLGRKSAAEKALDAKDEEAKHLEKAEEMKKLAQDAKVKAQAERHAKLLAEREAQKTA